MIKIKKIKDQESLKNWLNLKTWRPYFIILTLGFLLYSQTLWFQFTYLDDNVLVLANAPILQNIKNIGSIFSSDVFISGLNAKFYYRPLLNISLMLDNHLAGILPFIYHLDNILLYLISAGLVFYLLNCLLKRRNLAFFLSLIFLVHPVLTQAVAWIPGRNDSLLTIFVLAAFLSLLNFSARPKLKSLLAYGFFLGLALLTKETAVFLPILAIVYFFTIGRRHYLSSIDKFLVLAISLVSGFIWFLMRSLAFSQEHISLLAAFSSLIKNLLESLVLSAKMLLPFNLSVLPVAADSSFIYVLVAWPLIIGAVICSKHKRKDYLWLGFWWFLLFFLPPLMIADNAPYFLEQRLYLPLIGFLIVLSEIDWIKNLNFSRRRVQIGAILILLILSGITFYHSRNFSDRLTFWRAAVRTSPHSPLAQKNLGTMYYFIGDYFQAKKHDNLALALNSQEALVHNNLGVIYMNQKKYKQAEKEFKQELKVNPGYDKALQNLQSLYYRQKRLK